MAEDSREKTGACRTCDPLDHVSRNACEGGGKAFPYAHGFIQPVSGNHEDFRSHCSGDKADSWMRPFAPEKVI